ncbi:hypothetical protein CY34DRAFT_109844 [Suillus luteus UH-Slu-Lm8-n1]|uniref:Uncharacterized protein n=1 Tax=Suillus luteus UH-Slu-Lm8-n1 TaxID=930992 RepID=A0A0D0A1G7_9AGAM|nr:hypothetical protein CY34DRAFT_109844 [Suillus luteus UH-Slu-Lm8-n1]
MLPDKNLCKAIRIYYLWFLEDDEDQDDKEKIIQRCPKLTFAFKSEFSPFDVTQKLFKEENREYDKKHHDTSDLSLVADKWNQKGSHSDTKDRYCSHHQKKIIEDFIKMLGILSEEGGENFYSVFKRKQEMSRRVSRLTC